MDSEFSQRLFFSHLMRRSHGFCPLFYPCIKSCCFISVSLHLCTPGMKLAWLHLLTVLLGSAYKYFIENFCVASSERDGSIVSFLLAPRDLINTVLQTDSVRSLLWIDWRKRMCVCVCVLKCWLNPFTPRLFCVSLAQGLSVLLTIAENLLFISSLPFIVPQVSSLLLLMLTSVF